MAYYIAIAFVFILITGVNGKKGKKIILLKTGTSVCL